MVRIFLFFISFHCSQLFYCSPCPTAAPASLNMHVVSTNFAKTLVYQSEYDVILSRHKQRISSNKTTIRRCLVLKFRRGASNQAVASGITRPLHATGRYLVAAIFCPRHEQSEFFLATPSTISNPVYEM